VPKSSLLQGGKLKFSIISSTAPSMKKEETIFLEPSQNQLTVIGKDAMGNKITIPGSYEADKDKIDYGVNGWESFYIDIPKELRGQPATIQFELETNNLSPTQVYVDNVFFKSDNVILGNPTQAREEVNEQYKKNYIIEKPQYSLSYNSQKNTPNWVSWKLDRSWLGDFGSSYRPYGFAQDPDLDNSGWYQVNQSDYNFKFDYDDYFKLNRGHLSASADRSRSLKDLFATNLTTNIVPQDAKVNQSSKLWLGLENELRNKVDQFGQSFYIIAGGRGTNEYLSNFPAQGDSNQKIHVPKQTWKVVLGFNAPNSRLPGYTLDTRYPDSVYAVDIPNNGFDTPGKTWNDYRITIEELERRLNVEKNSNAFEYNFLSEITDTRIRENLKKYGTQYNQP
jgi:DNA/RNA endonuclease G (NUC1)